MPKNRFEEEIEEILRKADPDDELSPGDGGEDNGGELIPWEQVPRPVRARKPRARGRPSSARAPRIHSSWLIVAAVTVLVAGLATRVFLVPLLLIAVLLGAAAYFVKQREKPASSRSRQRRYWRGSPIDYGDDDDEAPPGGGRAG